jgi:hypothetical protein
MPGRARPVRLLHRASVVPGRSSSAVARFIIAAILLGASPLLSQEAVPASGRSDAWRFLTSRLPLTDADLREATLRRPVARTLETADNQEVATIGVTSVDVPASFYIDQLRNVAAFKSTGRAVLAIGTFSTPATIEDVAGLSLDPTDSSTLGRCRLHSCGIQLSREAIERIHKRLGTSRGDQRARVEREFRQILVDLVNRYRDRGDGALMTYADGEHPVSTAAAFWQMVNSGPAILSRLPTLFSHLSSFPQNTLAITDTIYWSKEDLGPAVVVTVTHLAITRLSDSDRAFAAASRQIYGSHYFDSSLGITVVMDADGDDGPRSFLVYTNRSRLDALGGLWGPLKRAVVRARTRSSVRENLLAARTLVERRFERRALGRLTTEAVRAAPADLD